VNSRATVAQGFEKSSGEFGYNQQVLKGPEEEASTKPMSFHKKQPRSAISPAPEEGHTSDWSLLESQLKRFETAWERGDRPQLSDFLDYGAEDAIELLVELVRVDLEYRLKTGDSARVEDYLQRYPQLSRPELMRDLVAFEFQQRSRREPGLDWHEYQMRFSTLNGFVPPNIATPEIPGLSTLPNADVGPQALVGTSGSARPKGDPSPVVPGYEIQELLGAGGMGRVFKALDRDLGRVVALKLIRREFMADTATVRRFGREARAAARLEHPNVVTIHHAHIAGDMPYLIMEYLEGTDLGRLVQQSGPLPVAQACDYIRQAALGLQHAHERGLVHRDIKPANLFLTDPGRQIKMLDMGLARVPQATGTEASGSALTDAGALMGTMDYMAPEQASDPTSVDARSDLYSLGCTFYYLLTGQPPFAHAKPLDKVIAHARDEALPVHQLRPEVPPAIARVVHRLLAKSPEERYPSAKALIKALDAALQVSAQERPEQQAKEELRPLNWKRSWKWRRPAFAAVLLLAVAAILVTCLNRLPPHGEEHPAAQADLRTVTGLTDLRIAVRRERDDNRIARFQLVNGRQQGAVQPIDPPLGPKDDFRLSGEFEQPKYWYLLWFDTKGVMTLAAKSAEPQQRVQYPERSKMMSVDPKDPPGVHVLVLASGRLPLREAGPTLQERFKDFTTKPPARLPERWSVHLRGPGEERSTHDTEADWQKHLRAITERLPPSLDSVQAIFLQTRK
jgi:serine/threonine protein kinase